MGIIKTDHVSYDYVRLNDEGEEEERERALDDVNIDVYPGSFVAILGSNGSGKSTLARHLNALLEPKEGTVWVDGMDTSKEENVFPVRREAGMVFQNPDNQIIAGVVEEDVAFGPENIGVPTKDIWTRVDDALRKTGMTAYRTHSPNRLSGGQKQRVAIAGTLAMHPKCIILDEPTAMLDPGGRREVIETVAELNEKEGVTVVLITHYMEEVIYADHVFVMQDGKLALEGPPREIFSHVEELQSYKLGVPQITLLAHELRKEGLDIPEGILSEEELAEAICRLR